MTNLKDVNSPSPVRKLAKRPYTTPSLLVFGQVASLTRSATGCNQSDNAGCSAPPSNMGQTMGSDRNIKQNIIRVGDHPLGFGLYLFDYKVEYRQQFGHVRQFGVMAQEVEAHMPEAVCVHPDGYRMVDYGLLGIAQPVH